MVDDDFDDDLLAGWEGEEQHALDVLLGAWPVIPGSTPPLPHLQAAVARIRAGVADNSWPYNYFRVVARWKPAPPHDRLQGFINALVCTMLPEADVDDWAPEDVAAVQSLTPADWIGSVIGVTRAGPAPRPPPTRCCGTSTSAPSSRKIETPTTTS